MFISSIFAFCSDDEKMHHEVRNLKNLLVRLMSLLYCAALQDVSQQEDENYEVLDLTGLSPDKMEFLISQKGHRCEILIQWIQKIVIKNMANGVITAPAPLLSRAFQELSSGVVGINNAGFELSPGCFVEPMLLVG